ncbi:MAG: F0F1 ATP synthase subunit A [Tannerellaceae bacterium]|nr:F0F1 ATP synthase subunit A [Tannerellaceae bacterium]
MRIKIKNRVLFSLVSFLLLLCSGQVKAEGIDVKEIVYEHLGDSYEWHLGKWGEKEISISLPVILYNKDTGWEFFLSSRLAHGQEYAGYMMATEGTYAGKIVRLNPEGEWKRPLLDLSLTKNVIGLWIHSMILLCLILSLARHYRKGELRPPSGIKGAVEILLIYMDEGVIRPCIGDDYRRFSPYLLTVFFFILINNLMGLVPFFPGGANLTGNIAITMVLALATFLVVNLNGSRSYWKEILWPEVPVWLKIPVPLMPVIELFGIFTKPFALMIRLFANIMAGHAVILGLVSLIFIAASMGAAISTGMTFLSVLFTLFMNCVELLVAFIQAYVFTLLSAVFIGSAQVKHINK